MHLQFYIDKRHLIYNQFNKPECMLEKLKEKEFHLLHFFLQYLHKR
jgi:hypothetical protein